MDRKLHRVSIIRSSKWYKRGEEYTVKDATLENADYYVVYDQSAFHGASILINDCKVIG